MVPACQAAHDRKEAGLSPADRRWIPPDARPGAGDHLARTLDLPPVAADILHARGYTSPETARRFLNPSLRDLAAPESQADLVQGAARLAAAIEAGEVIAVLGDYDVDGVAATALVVDFVRGVGGRAEPFSPDRFTDGYGVAERGIRLAQEQGAGLIVTVDCGANSPDALALAAQAGIDVIVCDHHPCEGDAPEVVAYLNPQRADCGFADRAPCATGVAFNLICGARRALRDRGWFGTERPEPNLKALLDLVALATVADKVPVTGHNRVLVSHGLEVIGLGGRPGLRALTRVASLRAPVLSGDLAFRLSPRLNAAGRLGDAARAVRLLLTRDAGLAERLARDLDTENTRRQRLEARVLEEAVAEIEADGHLDRPALVVAREGWHPGVVGIVAARLVERYERPAVVVGVDEGLGRGSARTVEGFDVGQAIHACAAETVTGGGHAGAAGVSVAAERIDAFRDLFCAQAEAACPKAGFEHPLQLDAEVDLTTVDGRLVDGLGRLEPFGTGNREPVLAARGLFVSDVRILKNAHLTCRLRNRDDRGSHRAIGFWMADKAPTEGARVDVAFTASWNEYRGNRSVQLRLRDLHIEEQK